MTIARSRSGLAWASCSSSQPETSILGPAAIAWLLILEIFGQNSMRITRWPSHITTPRLAAETSNTTSVDATARYAACEDVGQCPTDLGTRAGSLAPMSLRHAPGAAQNTTRPPAQDQKSMLACGSVVAVQNSVTLPSRMWLTLATGNSTDLFPREADSMHSATACSSLASTS